MRRWGHACALGAVLGGCCTLGPDPPQPFDAPFVDADLDASMSADVRADARGSMLDAWASTLDDVWVERTDGCVLPISADRVGLPCESGSDCPPGYACLPPRTLEPGPSCRLLAIERCGCPPGARLAWHLTASGSHVVCDAIECAARDTDLAGLQGPCTQLSDCAPWMFCEAGPAGSSCELPCSEQCACPGGLSCASRLRPDGIAQRCE